jgi:hypothetical protein
MIDPCNVTKYDRENHELEEFLMFSMLAAGKNADDAALKTDRMNRLLLEELVLKQWGHYIDGKLSGPLDACRSLDHSNVIRLMKQARTGKYKVLSRGFIQAGYIALDVPDHNTLIKKLLGVSGISLKTARFYLVHTNRKARYAVIDTHILKYLRLYGVEVPDKVSKVTPKKYLELEKRWLAITDKAFPNQTIAERDIHIWRQQSGRGCDQGCPCCEHNKVLAKKIAI